jgi:hypothetical protein
MEMMAGPPQSLYQTYVYLVADPAVILNGETKEVDVELVLDPAQPLKAYQVAVDVTGGTAGSLELESINVNWFQVAPETPFVFPYPTYSPSDYVSATDLTRRRLAASLYDDAITGTGPHYLGTFTFRASSDVDGTFTVWVRVSETHLRDENGAPVTIHQTFSEDVVVYFFQQ